MLAKVGMAGAKGESLRFVPVGTRIFNADTDEVGRPNSDEHSEIIAQGGKGGLECSFQNEYQSRTAQVYGKPGERFALRLELMVMADVGLLGYPNAGKSSFASQVSAAKPKVADYPFTTLAPKLGVVDMGLDGSFTIADIPGLIEGC